MIIKDTLDRPLRNLRISVTDKCNFRCTYCMPEDVFGFQYKFLPRQKILTFEEIARLVKLFVRLGVRKIRLTGGEPLLRQQLDKLVSAIAKIPGIDDLALTTNAYFLREKVGLLRQAGLQRLTVSLDTLDGELFRQLAGKHLNLEQVLDGLQAAVDAGFSPIKINSVIQRSVNAHEILNLAAFARDNGFIVRFIEYMDVGNLNGWKLAEVVTASEIVEVISAKYPLAAVDKNYISEVACRYRYLDGLGEIGVISSVSQPFCATCTRARLSADGRIFTCLFGTEGFDIKTPMRQGANDEELLGLIENVWQKRTDRYSEERTRFTDLKPQRKVEMYQIGG